METDEDGESVEQVAKRRAENKGGNSWSQEESQYLLRLYTKKSKDVGPDHTYRSKLHLWNDIAKRLNRTYQMQRTTVQCIGHYKSLQRKNFNSNNGGNNQAAKQSTVSSFELTSEEDGEINANESGSIDSQPSAIAEVIRSTLLEIHELKEEAKERRHRERMTLLEKYLQQSSANAKSTSPQPQVNGEEKVMKPAVLVLQQQQQQPQQQQQKKPSDEFLAMRNRLLEMQRKKMEDRERKHRGSVAGAVKTARLIVRDLK